MNEKTQMSIEMDKKISTSYLPIFKKISRILLFTFIFLFLNMGKSPLMSESVGPNTVNEIPIEVYYPTIVKERIRDSLVEEVHKYIISIAPTSKLDPSLLVDLCQKYEIDITFVLAQGLLESHFGTKGKAAMTNSVFNVGTFDNGEILYRYNTPNESVEPFLQLICNDYLNGKELLHLVKDRGYTNFKGRRYASSPIYEQSLRSLMVDINMKTYINMYQEILNLPNEKILAYFGPEIIDNTQLQANLIK